MNGSLFTVRSFFFKKIKIGIHFKINKISKMLHLIKNRLKNSSPETKPGEIVSSI